MIKELYHDLKAILPPGSPFYLPSQSSAPGVQSVFPRIVIAPDSEALTAGGAVRVPVRGEPGPDGVGDRLEDGSSTVEPAIVGRALEVVFLCQGKDEDQAERLLSDVILALDKAGLSGLLVGGSIDWHEHAAGKGAGITAILRVKAPGAFIRPQTWAILDTITPDPEITPTP